jgi:peptidoglycan/LPS O-acetylase OafA/YrhL
VAALAVFAFHVSFLYGLTLGHELPVVGSSLAPYLALLGQAGVAVFFGVSGFLLYRPFAQARLEGAPRPATGPYAVRRALRIFPAYWLALLVITVWLGLSEVTSLRGAVIHFGLLQGYVSGHVVSGIGQAWTLTIEVAFYLLLPLWAFALARVGARTRRAFLVSELAVLVGAVLVSVAWKAWAVHHLAEGGDWLVPSLISLPAYLDHFAVGMALAVVSVASVGVERPPRVLRLVDRVPWVGWPLAAVALWGMTRIHPKLEGWGVDYIAHRELELVLAIGVLLPAVFGLARPSLVHRVLSIRPLMWLGTVSYGFYLWHVVIATELEKRLGNSLGLVPYVAIAATAAAAVSAASWYGLERHAVGLSHRLTRRRAVMAAPAVVPEQRRS